MFLFIFICILQAKEFMSYLRMFANHSRIWCQVLLQSCVHAYPQIPDTHIHTRTHTNAQKHTQTYTQSYSCVHTNTYMHTYTHNHLHLVLLEILENDFVGFHPVLKLLQHYHTYSAV